MARYALHDTHNRCAQGSKPIWVFAVGLLLNVEPPHIKSGYGERNRYSQEDPPIRCYYKICRRVAILDLTNKLRREEILVA